MATQIAAGAGQQRRRVQDAVEELPDEEDGARARRRPSWSRARPSRVPTPAVAVPSARERQRDRAGPGRRPAGSQDGPRVSWLETRDEQDPDREQGDDGRPARHAGHRCRAVGSPSSWSLARQSAPRALRPCPGRALRAAGYHRTPWTTGCASPTSLTAPRPKASRPPPRSPSALAGRPSGRPTTSSCRMPTPRDYGRIYDAIVTLAWVGARHPGVRLGTSVIVVPMRNAVTLAKDLATLDSLSGGRVIAGVGIGWNETRVRQRRRRRPVPCPRRVSRRDHQPVAASLVRLERAVPRVASTRSTTSSSGRSRSRRPCRS